MIDTNDKHTAVSGFILERTAKRMKQHFQRQLVLAETDITIDQWVVLQSLNEENGLSQLDIAKATYKDAPTITRIIDLLCKKELTRRVPDLNDRRRFSIQLTQKGRKKIDLVMPVIQTAREDAWNGLSKEDMDVLVRVLNVVFDNLN